MKLQGVVVYVLCVVLVFSRATNVGIQDEFLEEAVSLIDQCGDKSISICAKERALKYMEQLPTILNFGGGLSMVPTDGVKRSSRYFNPMALPSDPEAREEALDAVLMERIVGFLSSHTFQFKFPEETLETLRRSFEDDVDLEEEVVEGRKKKKKKNMNLFMLLQLKAAAVGTIMLKLIGVVAVKALLMAKVALLIASILALKKATEKKHHSSTYEIIAAPYDDHGHYDRSISVQQPFDLAYNAYAAPNNNNYN